MNKSKLLLLCLMLLTSSMSYARFIDHHQQGWFWYDDPKKLQQTVVIENPIDPNVAMQRLQEKLNTAKNKAVLTPTVQNVRDYIQLQNEVALKATRFSTVWKQVLWQYPQLDYSITHPVSSISRKQSIDDTNIDKKHAIAQLAHHYGLFYFFRSTCPYCRRFSPIIKHFSERFHIPVMAITLDGHGDDVFPDAKQNLGQAERLKINVVPAVVAVSPKTGKMIPISYGLVSESELINRIYQQLIVSPTFESQYAP